MASGPRLLKPHISNGPVLNVAVIGCGEVSQVVHLPNLAMADHMYKTVAICDLSPAALEHCSKKFHIPETYTDVTAMLASPTKIDLVFVCSNDIAHCDHIVAALRAGKHVFTEKPMCQTVAECETVARVAKETGKLVFVGYMRRYAPALALVKERIKGREAEIGYLRIRDLIGNNMYFTHHSGMYQQYFPVPGAAANAAESGPSLPDRMRANFVEGLPGIEPTEFNLNSYMTLGSLGSHDLSAMRELVGMPKRVIAASRRVYKGKALWWNVLFDYGSFTAFYEMTIDDVPIFDAHLEVHTGKERIKIEYDSPYVKGLPITTTVLSSPNGQGDLSTEVYRPTFEDPYTVEMRELYACIVEGNPIKTTPEDAKNDTELNLMIMRAVVAGEQQ